MGSILAKAKFVSLFRAVSLNRSAVGATCKGVVVTYGEKPSRMLSLFARSNIKPKKTAAIKSPSIS